MEYVFISIGVIIGSVISNIIFLIRSGSGRLLIDDSDPERSIWRMKFDKDFDATKKKWFVFKVVPNANLSQK